MPRLPRLPRLAPALALLLAAAPAPAAADGWMFRAAPGGGTAGYGADGRFAGLWLSCRGTARRLAVATGGTTLQDGVDQSAVVTVDGTAFLQRMRAGREDGEPVLARPLAGPEFAALAQALARGRRAEVAMPAGRFALPLAGSGRALASLGAACGG